MEEQQAPMAAPFPTPPPFYQHFTKPNLTRLRQLRKDAGVAPTHDDDPDARGPAAKDIDILSLPPELRYLVPPAPPADGRYRSFGAAFDLHAPAATLASQGIEQLYPAQAAVKLNPQPHLLALTRSLLTTYLSLLGVLSRNPELFHRRVEDLQTMLYNMHELINEYRPHQARESLILMMEERVERLRDETRRIADGKDRADRVLRELAERRADADQPEVKSVKAPDPSDEDQQVRRSRERAAWQALQREFDTR